MTEITFLNIDLDIESNEDITPIIDEWGDRISVLRNEEVNGVYYGSFETSCSGIEEILNEYFVLINSLTPQSRKIWDNAQRKDFDFGYESGEQPNNFHSRVSPDLLTKLVEVGGEVVITIYPIQPV